MKCEHIYQDITHVMRSSCLTKIRRGCERSVKLDSAPNDVCILRKVKTLMQTIQKLLPTVKTVFCGNNYAAYLEGTFIEIMDFPINYCISEK